MTYALSWLAPVLRDAGLTVNEQPDWLTRGHGDFGTAKGIIFHHTAGPRAGNINDLGTLINGRPDLAGPLCNLGLARDGSWYCIAAGRAYHAGRGLWQGVADGNSQMIGIEAENTGLANDNPWPQAQIDSAVKGCAALLAHIGAKASMCAGHLEYALPVGRKDDPSFSVGSRADRIEAMNKFRIAISAAMGVSAASGSSPAELTAHAIPPAPTGTEDTQWLQHSLNALDADPQLKIDGALGPATTAAIKDFQGDHEMPVTGIADPATLAEIHNVLELHDGCACTSSSPS